MAGLNPPRLSAYAAVIFLAIATVQLIASLLFYRAIDEQTLREDHARRVAELLIVSLRVYERDRTVTPTIMTSRHLRVAIADKPAITGLPTADLRRMRARIVGWEPALAAKPLRLGIRPGDGGRRDLVGSLRLSDGKWLNFWSRDISSMWPIALRATWMTLVATLACLAFGLLALRLLTAPLRRLSEAAAAIGHGQRVEIRQSGPADLRNLARAMNDMQRRIGHLLEDQAKSFEAISHDLRTPLSRQKLAAGMIADAEIREIVDASADEMEAMLQSLQQFLRAQHIAVTPESIDVHATLQTLVAPYGDKVRLAAHRELRLHTYREPLSIALTALIDNACRFGETVEVALTDAGDQWFVEIRDDGPGIPAKHFLDVLTPFFRLDEARGRTTKGFGLGIPTANLLLRRFGGSLSFAEPAVGGFVVRVRIPTAR